MPFYNAGYTDAYRILATYSTAAPEYVNNLASEPTYIRQNSVSFSFENGSLIVRDSLSNEVLGKIKVEPIGQINETELIDILEQ